MNREKMKSNRHQRLKQQIRAFCRTRTIFVTDNLYRTRTGEKRPRKSHANTTSLGVHSKAGASILKGGEIMDKLTKQEKIDIGLIRPYSLTSDRLIVEDLAKGFPVEKIAKIYNRDVKDLKKHIGKIKGKVKSHRCEGEDTNFKDLYAAIFKSGKGYSNSKRHDLCRIAVKHISKRDT